jgi:hypothetical protein
MPKVYRTLTEIPPKIPVFETSIQFTPSFFLGWAPLSGTPGNNTQDKLLAFLRHRFAKKCENSQFQARLLGWGYRDRTGTGICWMGAREMNETSDANMTRQLVLNQYATKRLLLRSAEEYLACRFAVLRTCNSQNDSVKVLHTKWMAGPVTAKLMTGYKYVVNER